MGLIRYSCGHISGLHEPIHVKFGVWGFFIMFYRNIVMKMLKCKNENLMTFHTSVLYKVGFNVSLMGQRTQTYANIPKDPDDVGHDHRTLIFAIRQYHMINIFPYTLSDLVHPSVQS